jgi:hypothetical protein
LKEGKPDFHFHSPGHVSNDEELIMYCPSCGTALSQQTKFCNRCGIALTPKDSELIALVEKRMDSEMEVFSG